MTKTGHVPARSGNVPAKTASKQAVLSELSSALQVKAQQFRLRDDSVKDPATENVTER